MNTEEALASHMTKIYFKIDQDDSGLPPTPWESLWAKQVGEDIFEIENIPFYVMDVSPGDRVRAVAVGGRYEYQETVFRSGNSVFRVYVYDESKIQSARDRFRMLGVPSELSGEKLFAIEIPRTVDIEPTLNLLMEGQDADEWDIEEAALRHVVPE